MAKQRIRGTKSRPAPVRQFQGFCTLASCGYEGVAFGTTCPDCSQRTFRPGAKPQ